VIAVRPDWTDNRGLLGFYNPILRVYMKTEFLRLLMCADDEARAAEREGRPPEPHFVILDEMNLARAEHYFSDFLSGMESGRPIELHDDDEVEGGKRADADPVPKRLRVPSNLFITGTVNIDDTTYMFSPKVLDRAFVLELNTVDLEALGSARGAPLVGGLHLTTQSVPNPLISARRAEPADWDRLAGLLEGAPRRVVAELNRTMKAHGRHFGYRVTWEIARFVLLAQEQCGDAPDAHAGTVWTALDIAVLSKVLPKLHGTQQELELLLAAIFAILIRGGNESPSGVESGYSAWTLDADQLVPSANSSMPPPRLPRCAAKVFRMAQRLERQGFTSFIE
jgi:5-methylcytosine-specific restriction endonuclease McrBC GTP-binding regulatory subunit McrB